ncbi:16S rRNA (cytidine(1402)-2'-O)-methyltransferase [Caldicellulosiruptoraceae bacterium PP1]
MAGTLYIVATPIGNLDDITKRAIDTLNLVDIIACEDTRVTLKLLNYLNIKKPLLSYHKYSVKSRESTIINQLLSGKNIALVSDAGMPLISDPGEELINICYQEGIKVTVIPGACAFVSALVISGLSTKNFVFEGFLPKNNRSKKEKLNELKNEKRTIVFYEAPHKLIYTLEEMKEYFGSKRRISIVKEITKLHENVFLTTIEEAIDFYKSNPPKGEYVLIVEGSHNQVEEIHIEDVNEFIISKLNENIDKKQIIKEACEKFNISRNEVYKMILDLQKNNM